MGGFIGLTGPLVDDFGLSLETSDFLSCEKPKCKLLQRTAEIKGIEGTAKLFPWLGLSGKENLTETVKKL